MININETAVAVETSAELKTVLEGANEITKIYLAKDITLESGIIYVYAEFYIYYKL